MPPKEATEDKAPFKTRDLGWQQPEMPASLAGLDVARCFHDNSECKSQSLALTGWARRSLEEQLCIQLALCLFRREGVSVSVCVCVTRNEKTQPCRHVESSATLSDKHLSWRGVWFREGSLLQWVTFLRWSSTSLVAY